MNDFVSADGSPLAMYLAIPPGEEPAVIDGAIGPNSSILELGSGPGRITRVLVALGHKVVAVDDSIEMLEHVTGATRLCTDVFDVALEWQFDCVLAGSHLINDPEPERRRRLLEICSRHMAPGGVTLVERYPPGWATAPPAFESTLGMVAIGFAPLSTEGGILTAQMTYELGTRRWVQRFEAVDVGDEVLADDAAKVGLHISQKLTEDQSWVALRRLQPS